jgi:hypothetical protein
VKQVTGASGWRYRRDDSARKIAGHPVTVLRRFPPLGDPAIGDDPTLFPSADRLTLLTEDRAAVAALLEG